MKYKYKRCGWGIFVLISEKWELVYRTTCSSREEAISRFADSKEEWNNDLKYPKGCYKTDAVYEKIEESTDEI